MEARDGRPEAGQPRQVGFGGEGPAPDPVEEAEPATAQRERGVADPPAERCAGRRWPAGDRAGRPRDALPGWRGGRGPVSAGDGGRRGTGPSGRPGPQTSRSPRAARRPSWSGVPTGRTPSPSAGGSQPRASAHPRAPPGGPGAGRRAPPPTRAAAPRSVRPRRPAGSRAALRPEGRRGRGRAHGRPRSAGPRRSRRRPARPAAPVRPRPGGPRAPASRAARPVPGARRRGAPGAAGDPRPRPAPAPRRRGRSGGAGPRSARSGSSPADR